MGKITALPHASSRLVIMVEMGEEMGEEKGRDGKQNKDVLKLYGGVMMGEEEY